jgi:hypothetical protein
MNGTHQLLVCAGDVNLVGHNINTAHTNTDALTEGRKLAGLEENTDNMRTCLRPGSGMQEK